MIQPRTLYAWDADRDRRLVCVAEAPFGDDGEALMLFNGMSLDPGVTINLELPRKGAVADFLYSPTLHLFVSERAVAVIRRANVPQMRTHPVVLRDRVGRALDDTYSWINVMPLVALLDRERSVFTEREYGGGIQSLSHLVVAEHTVPPDDLFLFRELNLAVFSEPLVRALAAIDVTGAVFEDLNGLTWPT